MILCTLLPTDRIIILYIITNIFELGLLIVFKYWKERVNVEDTKRSTEMAITSMSDLSINENKSIASKEHSYEEGQNDRSDSDDLFDTGHVTRDGNDNHNSDTDGLLDGD